ncbi:MAG: FxLYD domain-containing protein [Candidatus Nitrosocosmicus sp.]
MSFSNRNTQSVMLIPLIMISLLCSVFSFSGLNSVSIGSSMASAQTLDSNPIQILSTSTYSDDLGKFHIVGEVNNTSTQPQNNVEITAILSNTTNNVVIGNHSAFTSINTLRTGELSPFDIVIQDPQQILGKFNFMEFIASSQPSTDEKPANLVLNGSGSFLDTSGNPHITGNIINQGQNPEQSLNLVVTFYDNSSLGVIGTQSFGLNVENLTQNQMAPFDITITDNKTKSQGAFYSLNVDSSQSAMSTPLNTKTPFASTGGSTTISDYSLNNGLPVNNPPLIVNNKDDEFNARDNDNDDNNDDDDRDDQRGEKKTDDQGNPWFDDNNCSEKPGSSGGSSSECEEAEREEESEGDDEDSSEKDQGPPSNSNSDSTNGGNDDENENSNGDDNSGDENTETNDGNSAENDGDSNNDDN